MSSEKDDFKNDISLSIEKVTRILGWTVFYLVIFHIILQAFHYFVSELPWLLREIFDVDEEESFSTWFSAIILFGASFLLFLIARDSAFKKEKFSKHWYGLAIGFGILSMDEVVGMHETFNTVTEVAWTVPFTYLTVAIFVVYWKFLIHLPSEAKRNFLIAGSIFLSGGLLVEHLADYYVDIYEMDNFGYQLLTAFEETLEMVGVILFIRALLQYISSEKPESFRFSVNSK
jgi:hypothetical protein